MQQRVTIRRGLGDDVGADHPARAGTVVDHHGLPERIAEFLSHDARQHIRGAAGRQKYHHAQWASWIVRLGMGGKAASQRD